MAFTLPTFNLLCNIWHSPNVPVINPPDIALLRCNLAWGRRTNVGLGNEGTNPVDGNMTLLLPALSDIRDVSGGAARADFVEVPAGTGRYYFAAFVDDIGKGFANEHRGAVIVKTIGSILWPIPIP